MLAEGRAASALNHPNILRVYDADVDGTWYYLVSEWLEGKSLRDELSRGPLPLKRLLDLSVQIADGLAAAHAIGIVHKDIKPENVMLAKDGTARIVDFGLARSTPDGSTLATSGGHATTVSLEGGLSGTPAYMSPEQARGTAGDFRTDQFSFGALVYEMATGTFAFRRDSVADTLSAVLHEEPTPIAEVNARIPAPFRWMLERCLAKDPSERYAATEDLARELRAMRDHWSEALAEPRPDRTPVPRTGSMMLVVAGVALIAGMLTTPGVLWMTRFDPAHTFTPLASASEYEGRPSWAPDGQSVAYVADVNGVLQVFVRRLNAPPSTQVTQGRFDAHEPAWAPDGQRLYFISLAGESDALWSVGVTGGRPELVLENVTHAAVDPTGKRLALLRRVENSLVYQRLSWSSPSGADPVLESRPPFDDAVGFGGQLKFSPDGRKLLAWTFNAIQAKERRPSRFYLLPAEGGGAPREVLATVGGLADLTPFSWLPDNRHVVLGDSDASGGNRHLWIADTESTTARQLTSTHTNETFPAVSPDGRRIAYESQEVDFDLMAISADGRATQGALATARNEFDPVWSPAGDQFAFVTDRYGPIEVWVRSRDGQWERPVVTSSNFDSTRTDTLGSLAFSPNGRTLAYQRRGPDWGEVWLSPITGGTPVRLLPREDTEDSYQDAPSWSVDGEWIAFTRRNGPRFSLAKVRVGTNQPVELASPVRPFSGSAWSPDGEWIAFETPEGLARVRAEGGPAEPINVGPWLAFTWASDSRRLFALGESESPGHFALMELNADTGESRVLNPDLGPIPILSTPVRGLSFVPGQGFLTSLASVRSDIWLLEGFQQPAGLLGRLLRGGR